MKVVSYSITVNEYPHMPHLRQQIREHWVEMPEKEDSFCFNMVKGHLSVFWALQPRSGLEQVESTVSDSIAETLKHHCADKHMLERELESWARVQPKPKESG